MTINDLFDYIREHELLSESELSIVDKCLNDIKEMSPADKPSVFRKTEKIIEDSEDLSWCVYALRLQKVKLQKAYRVLKDPEYVTLVRLNRPSSEAINSEIRFRNEDMYRLEEDMAIVDNILAYIEHIQVSMERYLYMLKDKLKYE